jgi:hypothetical protein
MAQLEEMGGRPRIGGVRVRFRIRLSARVETRHFTNT